MKPEARSLTAPSSLATPFRLAFVGGAFLVAMGAVVSPSRLLPVLLWIGFGLLGVGVAALYFLAIHSVTGAAWATAFKRVPEALSSLVWVGGLVGLAAVAAGAAKLYPVLSAEHAGEFPVFKQTWYEPSFFFARSILCVAVLSAFAWVFQRLSRRQDLDGSLDHTRHLRALSCLFLVLGSVAVVILSFDWLMALEPWWYSTIFGVYNFAGLFQSGLAMLVVVLIWLKRRGVLDAEFNRDHLQDVAKFMFGMSTFWMYIWYSQYVLIWYTNIPEETAYFTLRMTGSWLPLFYASPILNWVIPFHVLMARAPKRNPTVVYRVALILLAGRALDLYLMIYPPLFETGPKVGLAEVGALLIVAALTVLVTLRVLGKASLVPVGDPYLDESLHHHQ